MIHVLTKNNQSYPVPGSKHEVRPDVPLLDRQLQQARQPLQLRHEAGPLLGDRGRETLCRLEPGRQQHQVDPLFIYWIGWIDNW